MYHDDAQRTQCMDVYAGSNRSRSSGRTCHRYFSHFHGNPGHPCRNPDTALSGALLTQYQGFADINMGRGSIVIGLAAVIIGEAIFSRIFRNFALKLLSVVFGSILYYLVLQVVIWMGIDTDLLKMLSALVVALFLAFPYWKGRYFTKAKQGGK